MRWTVPVAVVLIGCSPFGEDDRARAEGGAPAADGGDAGADAASVDGGARDFESCATTSDPQRIFCSDFEDPTKDTSPFGWTDEFNTSPGAIALAPGVGMGATRGLRVTLNRGTAFGRSRLLRFDLQAIPTASAHWELSFDFLLEKGELDYQVIGGFQFGGAASSIEGVAMYNRGALIDEVDPADAPDLRQNVVGSFHHAVVRLDREDRPGRYRRTIQIDDVQVDSTPGVDLTRMSFGDVRIGVFYTGGNDASASVVFDNVVVRRY